MIETGPLHLSFEAGDSGTHVVSFTGIAHRLGPILQAEFGQSLRGNFRHAVSYVIEGERAWYDRSEPAILDFLLAPERRRPRFVTLGNSMGGFGAIHFAGLLPGCRRAIAFSPQYSVHPAEGLRVRKPWQDHVDTLPPARIRHALLNPAPACEYFVLTGEHDLAGAPHIDRYRAAGLPNLHILTFQGVRHRVARALKEAGCLVPVLGLLIEGETDVAGTVQTVCTAHGLSVSLG